jgi:cobalamin biosynthesis protein CbiD
MNDGAFVGGDGMGSVFERGVNVVDGGLAVLYVERSRFEKNISLCRREPLTDVSWFVWRGRSRPRTAVGRIRIQG